MPIPQDSFEQIYNRTTTDRTNSKLNKKPAKIWLLFQEQKGQEGGKEGEEAAEAVEDGQEDSAAAGGQSGNAGTARALIREQQKVKDEDEGRGWRRFAVRQNRREVVGHQGDHQEGHSPEEQEAVALAL